MGRGSQSFYGGHKRNHSLLSCGAWLSECRGENRSKIKLSLGIALPWESMCHGKLWTYSKRLRQGEGFKGKSEKDYKKTFWNNNLETVVNNKGDISGRLNKELLVLQSASCLLCKPVALAVFCDSYFWADMPKNSSFITCWLCFLLSLTQAIPF